MGILTEKEWQLLNECASQQIGMEEFNLKFGKKMNYQEYDSLLNSCLGRDELFHAVLWYLPVELSVREKDQIFKKYLGIKAGHQEHEELLNYFHKNLIDPEENISILMELIESPPSYFIAVERADVFIHKCLITLLKQPAHSLQDILMHLSKSSNQNVSKFAFYQLRITGHKEKPMNEELNSYHIIFSPAYLDKMPINKAHPTCNIQPENENEYVFGGSLHEPNDKYLNRLITISPIPKNIGVTTVPKLTLAIDFELFFNSLLCGKYLFYQHDKNGYPSMLTKDIVISNVYDKKPIIETKVKLGRTPVEWTYQMWGDGNNNKIGGEPTWVQEPEYLNCPSCGTKMTFLMQLNSDLPVGEPVHLKDGGIYKDNIMFGSGGICYAYWCDKDQISGFIWQST